jgi:hypothetical protein
MCKTSLWAFVFVASMSASASAETYAEKLKAVDSDKKTITFAADGKERTFKVDAKVDVQSQVRRGKRLAIVPVKDGLKGVKAGREATVTTEKRDGEEMVTKIVLLVEAKK